MEGIFEYFSGADIIEYRCIPQSKGILLENDMHVNHSNSFCT